MDNVRKRQIRKYISWALLVAAVGFLAAMPLLARTEEISDGPRESILFDTVQNRTLEKLLLGGGTLAVEEPVEITVPAEVKLTEFLVSNGDSVMEGDAVASVDRVSVMSAITAVQETMDELREEIEDAAGEKNNESVKARAVGTVKLLHAAEGDNVQTVMLEHGALAVLSLDGLMAVEIQGSTDLAVGENVTVTCSDGTEITGRVESNLDGILVVTVRDEGFPVGEKVQVATSDGDRVGTGTLYIHSPWNAVAYSGTVGDIRVKTEQTVTAGKTLMTLEDTGVTAQYLQLTAEHREYEALMLELFRMYQTTVITAPCDGVVTGIDKDSPQLLHAGAGDRLMELLTNAPDGSDTQYQNFVGRVTAMGIDGMVLRMNPEIQQITDYADLSALNLDDALMTEEVVFSDIMVPVYGLVGGVWQQLSWMDIAAGDILLFASDDSGNFIWIIRVTHTEPESEVPEEPTESTEPTEPQPEETLPGTPETEIPDINIPSNWPTVIPGAGSMGGYFGGIVMEEEEKGYTLDTVTVASVVPQDTVTVTITVDELDISSLSVGQEAAVTVDALPGETFTAFITDIGNTGTGSGGNSKFTLELTMARTEKMLGGMHAAASILLERTEDVLTIPVAALVDTGRETVVYTAFDAENEVMTAPVAVTTGASDGEFVQILSGLEPGSEFCYAYYDTLEISHTVESGFEVY